MANKPTIRPDARVPDQARVTFPCGGTALVFKPVNPRAIPGIDEWSWQAEPAKPHADGDTRQGSGRSNTAEAAVEAAWVAVFPAPKALVNPGLPSPAKVDSLDRSAYTKLLRKVLKQRTGRIWSVKGSTGTAYSWIRIDAPPKRNDNYRMSSEDRALISAVFGQVIHHQGEQIPPTPGFRAWHVYKAAGASTSEIELKEHAWADN